MAIRDNREYRSMPVMVRADGEKKFDTEYYVEGYATTFDDPYVLWEDIDGRKMYEKIDRHALDEADLSDVLFLYNHEGAVYARNRMKQGKAPTLFIDTDDKGIFVAADLGSTTQSREMFESIETGLIYQMSWAFTVAEDSFDRETQTRTILKIKKVYDVSAVDMPANPSTEISARNYFDGVVEAEKQEIAETERRKKQAQKIKILCEVNKNGNQRNGN